MSRLNDLYKAMETLRKEGLSLNEDLEKQINELEENIIKKEILPIVTESIAPVLKQVQRELVIVVDYVPGEPTSVHLSRKRNFTATITDAKEIIPDPQVTHRNVGRINHKSNIAPATRLRIIFENGKIIQEPTAVSSFYHFIKEVGVERVRSLGIIRCKVPLISNTLDNKYKHRQKPLGNGWFLMTNTDTSSKKQDIEYIANSFGIKIQVEII